MGYVQHHGHPVGGPLVLHGSLPCLQSQRPSCYIRCVLFWQDVALGGDGRRGLVRPMPGAAVLDVVLVVRRLMRVTFPGEPRQFWKPSLARPPRARHLRNDCPPWAIARRPHRGLKGSPRRWPDGRHRLAEDYRPRLLLDADLQACTAHHPRAPPAGHRADLRDHRLKCPPPSPAPAGLDLLTERSEGLSAPSPGVARQTQVSSRFRLASRRRGPRWPGAVIHASAHPSPPSLPRSACCLPASICLSWAASFSSQDHRSCTSG